MAEDALDPGIVLRSYFATFGDAGDFDRFLLPPDINLHLMADALKRGSPVTDREVKRTYKALTGEEYRDPPPDAVR